MIVAHGERGGAGDDRLVHTLVERLQRLGDYRTVQSCFISKEPSLKSIFSKLSAGPALICPLFMSDGYFVKQAIPRSVGLGQAFGEGRASEVRILTPVGLSPKLPRLIAEIVEHAAQASGLKISDCRVLLVAHGSKHDQASRDATRRVATALEMANAFAGISVSFLEESPFLDAQLGKIKGPAIAVGLFIGEGMHGAEDLPGALKRADRDDIVLSPPLSHWPGLMDLICDDLAEVNLNLP